MIRNLLLSLVILKKMNRKKKEKETFQRPSSLASLCLSPRANKGRTSQVESIKSASEAVSHPPWIRRQEKMKKDELEKQAPFNISPHGPSREHRAETAAPANAVQCK